MVSYIAEAERFWRKSKHENRIRTADTRKRRRDSVLLRGVLQLMKHGMTGVLPSTFATGQMQRLGRRWLLAKSEIMGTPARCMTLTGIRSICSNVLKYTRNSSLWNHYTLAPWLLWDTRFH